MTDEREPEALLELLDLHDGAVPAAAAAALRERLATDAMLQEEQARLTVLLAVVRPPSATFAPGFADRVQARIAAEAGMTATLWRQFPRLAAAAALVIVTLGAGNAVYTRDAASSFVEAVFGLTPVTYETVLADDGADATIAASAEEAS